MRALYRGAPNAADLEPLGLTVDDEECASPNPDGWYYDQGDKDWRCELWPQNWPVINFYIKWHNQWNVASGMSGTHYIGLNFGVLLQMLDRLSLEPDEYDDMLGCLREIESEAKKHLNKPA